MKMSRHAEIRAQQRAIPPLIRDWLVQHGRRTYRHGALVCYFDKKSRKSLAALYGHAVVDQLSSLLNSYLVITDDEEVITTGHRYKRIHH